MNFDFFSDIVKRAGEVILEVYETEFEVKRKDDCSPVTLADTRSHRVIADALRSRYPEIPVVSEEGKGIPFEVRKNWERFWLVDPLDGTKEFVKRNGEFTINIALIEGCEPVLGIIYIPVQERLYIGDIRAGCWEFRDGARRELHVSAIPENGPVRIVRSRSHPSPVLENLLSLIPSHEIISRGSALKFCAVAGGEADFYPRFGPTWEWDTAAGQAIVTAAGGVMLRLSGEPFVYNKDSLLNGPFIVASSLEWLKNNGILEKAAGLEV